MNERERTIGAQIWRLNRFINSEIVNKQNLEVAKKHLETGSILLYFNHFSKLDSYLLGKIVEDNLTNLDNATAIGSMKHFDPKRGIINKAQNKIAQDWEKSLGVKVIPVIQDYDMDSYENADAFNSRAVRKVTRILQTPGQVVAISPEGTRSKNGELIKAQSGLEILFRLARKTSLALPIAMPHSTIFPLATKTTVIVGEPFSYEEIQMEYLKNPNTSITDLMMKRLANLLPEKNQGYYQTPTIRK